MKTPKNSKFATFLSRTQTFLLYSLPAVLFLSYYPVISLGSTETMNLELSIPLIWLVLFFFASIPRFFEFFKDFHKKTVLYFLFPLYLTLSILWSPNKPRAILTTGVFWLIIFAIISIYQIFKDKNVVKNTTFKAKIITIFFLFTSVICLFCWLQCFLDIVGVSRETTLLCPGCTYLTFGFPHPSGFAIEPQFMGNLLLAPSILSLYLFITSAKNRKIYLSFSLIFVPTLFLTLSRGAIYSFSVSAVVLAIYYLAKKQKIALLSIPVVLISILISLLAQGLFSELSPTNDTFYSGIAKSIHQLSLGKIDIRPGIADLQTRVQPEKEVISQDGQNSQENTAIFDGYIESSTYTRLSINERAINTWAKNSKSAIFGVGIGGAGMAVSQVYDDFSPKEIIQNQYLSILLELGVIGWVLAIFPIALFIKKIFKKQLFWLFTIILAYVLSILFFSGLPNALHIYLLPPLLYFVFPENKLIVNQKVKHHHH